MRASSIVAAGFVFLSFRAPIGAWAGTEGGTASDSLQAPAVPAAPPAADPPRAPPPSEPGSSAGAPDPKAQVSLEGTEFEAGFREQAAKSGQLTKEMIARLSRVRDPFQKPELAVKKLAASPLESYAVEQLELIGVITGPERVRALIRTPDGKTHMVHEKTKLGSGGGSIQKITPEAIVVRERIQNALLGEEEVFDKEIKIKNKKHAKDGAG